jgi:hypothetical protein
MEVLMSQMVSLVAFGLMAAGVWKAYQIGGDLNEIKDILRDISRNTRDYSKPAPPLETGLSSPVELLHAVNSESLESSADFEHDHS